MLNIVIAMAGLSSRFTKAGYTLPKYMLYAGGKSLFAHAVGSFVRYKETARFVFVARDLYDTSRFIDEECRLLGIKEYKVVVLDHPTRGQAETVAEGIRQAGLADGDSLLVFNIDTFRPDFVLPAIADKCDGYLEVFCGEGANWSYARTESNDSTRVVETAEKKEISHYCSTGLYYFAKVSDYLEAYAEYAVSDRELYVAPMYNILIGHGKNIHISLIETTDVIFCGTPQEYDAYIRLVNGCKRQAN